MKYRHYKGGEYELLGMATVISKTPDFGDDTEDRVWSTIGAFPCEDPLKLIFVWLDEKSGQRFVVDPFYPDGKKLAVYRSTSSVPRAWLRDFDEFMGHLDNGDRRFEPVVDPIELAKKRLADRLEQISSKQIVELDSSKTFLLVFKGDDLDHDTLHRVTSSLAEIGVKARCLALPEETDLAIFDVSLTKPE